MAIQALREQRDAKAKALKELANKADYNPTNDNAAFDALADEVSTLDERITRITKANEMAFEEAEGEQLSERMNQRAADERGPRSAALKAFAKWARHGDNGLTAEERKALRSDLGTGTGGAGGFTVQTDVAETVLDALKDYSGMRQVATQFSTEGGNPLQMPASDGTAEEGAIVAENGTAGDLDPVFTQIPLPVYKYSSLVVPISLELVQDSQIDVEGFVVRRLVDRLGRIQNKHFTIGTGSGQPRGISVAAAVGKAGPTGQTLTVTYDDIVDLEFSVDAAYRARPDAAFMMSDLALRQVRKIKDSAGLPIFARSMTGASAPTQVNTLNGYPIISNNHMPVMAADAKSIVFGALAEYHIRDVMEMLLQRYDDSAYAKKGQIGFNAWLRTGGNLIDNGGAVKAYQNSAT